MEYNLREMISVAQINGIKKMISVYGLMIIIMSMLSCSGTSKLSDEQKDNHLFALKANIKKAEVDNLGRLYIVDNKNRIINYKPDLKEMYRYANTKGGQVTTLDVTNPLRVVAFYDAFNFVKVFDNTLTIISELNLADKFADVSACSVTNDGNLWIFDPVQFKLIKIRDDGSILLESSNVNDFGMQDVNITDIREKGNYVVLCDRNKGFYFFDNFGQYLFHYQVEAIKSFQFDGRNVFYYNDLGLKSYSVKFKERMSIGFPMEMKKDGLMYILYQAGDLYEVNEAGINHVKKAAIE